MLFKTFVLILLCSFHPKCDSQIQSKEVDCEICSCKTVKIRFAVEFQVTCEGNELTKIVLSKRIFREEPKPNLTRKIVIKIANFTEAKIDKSFLAIWSSYTSCLLDIKEVRKVTFPDEAPERAESGAAIFIFGGLVITNSTINKIPKNLFKKTESVGLKLISSQIGSLNLFEVSQETLNFLDVENSIIESIKGFPGMSLKFATSPLRSKYQSFIKIKESKIGYIGENSFNFTHIDKYTPAILIWKTTVGLIDTSAIILGKGTIFDLRESSIGNVLPDGIKFIEENRKESVSIINNFMVVNEDFVKGIKCDNVTEVRDNIFYISNTTNTHSLQNIYSDLSCKNNYVVNKHLILKTREGFLTTDLASTSTMKVGLTSENTTPTLATEHTEEIKSTVPTTSSTTTATPTTTVEMTTTPTTTEATTTTPTTILTKTTTLTTTRTSSDRTTTTTAIPMTTEPLKCPSTETSSSSSNLPILETTEKALIQEPINARALNPQISTTLFLIVVCLCIFLVIAVLCLSFYVICKKSRKKQKFHHSDDRTSTCLYEEPNAYFVPKPPQPLKFQNLKTVDKDTDENDRYQVKLGLGSKKGGILCQEESLYLNMS